MDEERLKEMDRYTAVWSAKGLADEARTLDEIIEKLLEEAETLKRWRKNGVKLSAPVEYDSAFLETTNVALAAEEGFDLEEFEK